FDERVIRAFAAHVALALERRRLQDEARQADEWRRSLELGRQIQTMFLPKALPHISGYEVAASWQPAEFVSGDYYDWLPLPDGRWAFVTGDVSGHGPAAALIMATARAMLHGLTHTESDPQRCLDLLRDSVEPDLSEGRFLTFVLLALDPKSHGVMVAN